MIVAIRDICASIAQAAPSPERDWLLAQDAIIVETHVEPRRVRLQSRSRPDAIYYVGERCQCPKSQYSKECFHTRVRAILLAALDARSTPVPAPVATFACGRGQRPTPKLRTLSAAEIEEIEREVAELFS